MVVGNKIFSYFKYAHLQAQSLVSGILISRQAKVQLAEENHLQLLMQFSPWIARTSLICFLVINYYADFCSGMYCMIMLMYIAGCLAKYTDPFS